MRWSSLLVIAWVVVLGCSSKQEATPAPVAPATETAPTKPEEARAAQPQRVLDVRGNLMPSDEYLVGIRLPRGVELFRADEVSHVYRIRAPIDRVLAYFGPMMITGKVERRGEGAVYRQASVRGAEVNPTKVDVSILEVGPNLVRIAITELPPPAAYVPSSEQTKAVARDTWRRLD